METRDNSDGLLALIAKIRLSKSWAVLLDATLGRLWMRDADLGFSGCDLDQGAGETVAHVMMTCAWPQGYPVPFLYLIARW
jgi:hypothetical protein